MLRSHRFYSVNRITALAGVCAILFAGIVGADTLRVKPEQLRLSASKPVANLTFTNSSTEDRFLDFQVGQWHQEEDREWVSPTTRLIVVPERMTLKPGESAEVQVVLRLSASWWEEEAFQVMVTESSRIPDLGLDSGYSADTRTTWPSSVPVFLVPSGKAVPRLSWSLERSHEGVVFLHARNNGRGHARLYSASLLGPQGQSIQKAKMSDVILPGGTRTWEFPTFGSDGFWQLAADTNAGPLQLELELQFEEPTEWSLSFAQ